MMLHHEDGGGISLPLLNPETSKDRIGKVKSAIGDLKREDLSAEEVDQLHFTYGAGLLLKHRCGGIVRESKRPKFDERVLASLRTNGHYPLYVAVSSDAVFKYPLVVQRHLSDNPILNEVHTRN